MQTHTSEKPIHLWTNFWKKGISIHTLERNHFCVKIVHLPWDRSHINDIYVKTLKRETIFW